MRQSINQASTKNIKESVKTIDCLKFSSQKIKESNARTGLSDLELRGEVW